jgi:hypothetical protein
MENNKETPKRKRIANNRNVSAQTIAELRETNILLSKQLNTFVDRAVTAEAYLEEAINFIVWAKQMSMSIAKDGVNVFEINDNFNQVLAFLTNTPIPESEKPAEIVNENIILLP